MPLPDEMPSPSVGVPPTRRRTPGGHQELQQQRSADATQQLRSQVDDRRDDGIFRHPERHLDRGLNTPPDRCAIWETMTAITRPCARATHQVELPVQVQDHRPRPKKIKANVPMNSAIAALPLSSTVPLAPCAPSDIVARERR
jgi:hypothetical protein